jgi:hypothetical protein
LTDFKKVDHIYIEKNKLYTTEDVAWEDTLDLKGLVLYKFDEENSALLSAEDIKSGKKTRTSDNLIEGEVKTTDGLKRCDPLPNIGEAESEFSRLINSMEECRKTIEDKDCLYVPQIPKEYSIEIENGNLVMKYNSKEINSIKLNYALCLLEDFRGTTNKKQLNLYNFNNYFTTEFFFQENKLCFGPYSEEQLRIRNAARLANIIPRSRSLVPE